MNARLVTQICDLYDEVFSRPPFIWRNGESKRHRQLLEQLLKHPTHAITLARYAGQLVGFAYGQSLIDGDPYRDMLADLPPAAVAEWPASTFLLYDLAVRPAYRHRGIGRAMHDMLLASRSENFALLHVQPDASDAQAMYERWNWQRIGRLEAGTSAPAPSFEVFALDKSASRVKLA
jgi:ribosomal protein S18 acetylase RimI-like enzyme